MAAHRGQIDVLKWLRRNESVDERQLCLYAAGGKQLEALKWARSNGYEWNEAIGVLAATNGDFKMLKWATQHDCPLDAGDCICHAQECGALHVVHWIRDLAA